MLFNSSKGVNMRSIF